MTHWKGVYQTRTKYKSPTSLQKRSARASHCPPSMQEVIEVEKTLGDYEGSFRVDDNYLDGIKRTHVLSFQKPLHRPRKGLYNVCG